MKALFVDPSPQFADRFVEEYGGEWVSSIAECIEKLPEHTIWDLVSLGDFGTATDDLVSYLILYPQEITKIIIHIPQLARNHEVYHRLRLAGYSVDSKRAGITWLREEGCAGCRT